MAGKGDTPLTRTVVQAHRWVADGVEEYRDSTRWWLDGAQVEPVRLTREYARDGRVLNRHPIAAARIADEVRHHDVSGTSSKRRHSYALVPIRRRCTGPHTAGEVGPKEQRRRAVHGGKVTDAGIVADDERRVRDEGREPGEPEPVYEHRVDR